MHSSKICFYMLYDPLWESGSLSVKLKHCWVVIYLLQNNLYEVALQCISDCMSEYKPYSHHNILIFVLRVMVFNQQFTFLASSQLTTNIHWLCYCTVVYMFSLIFVIVCGLWEWKWVCVVFDNIVLLYMYIFIVVGDKITRKGDGVGYHKYVLPHHMFCLSRGRTCISIAICCCLVCVQWFQVRDGCSFCRYKILVDLLTF